MQCIRGVLQKRHRDDFETHFPGFTISRMHEGGQTGLVESSSVETLGSLAGGEELLCHLPGTLGLRGGAREVVEGRLGRA